MRTRELHKQLLEIIPSERLIPGNKMPFRYRFDALRPYRPYPGIRTEGYPPTFLVRPESVPEVVQIVKIARRARTPIVPYGAGTGLMGAAIPIRGGLLIDTSLLREFEVSNDDHWVHAQAGVILEDLYESLNKYGFLFAHDPWTRPIATLGGGISTNSLGYLGAKYGSLGNQLLAVEVVLPDGRLLRTRPAEFSSTGFDMKRLFIGTEGQFGLVTSATVRAYPKPERFALACYRFHTFEQGFNAICALRNNGIRPSMIDYGQSNPHMNGETELNLTFDGLSGEVEAQLGAADAAIEKVGGSKSDQQTAQHFWDHRHDIAINFAQRVATKHYQTEPRTKFDYLNVSLPTSKILQFNSELLRITKARGVELLEAGLWQCPELFSIVLSVTDSKPKLAGKRLWETSNEILRLVQDLGGCMEFCHGVGLKLAHLMEREHGLGLEVMRRLKHAVDPLGIMNPGKEAI
ncbi:MAG TPA: FAD-binding oxidoreductase [Candidatus Bathyarchaeia archaeon]|nr:FAD-binding oxidoreductase [Candidatus Bathyarchaeia archaeon]